MAAVTTDPNMVMEATEGFVCLDERGQKVIIQKGATRMAASHEIVKRFPDRFIPIGTSFADDADMSADPGQKARRTVSRSQTRSN